MPSTLHTNMLASLLLLIFFYVSFEIYTMRHKDTASHQWVETIIGVWLGGIVIALTQFKLVYGTVDFDFRTVVLCLCGLFFGTRTTLAALAISVAGIAILGIGNTPASALIAECTYTIAAGATGAILHNNKQLWGSLRSIMMVVITIVITQAIMTLCIYIAGTTQDNINDHAMVILAILPTTTLFFATIMTARTKQFETERRHKLLEDKYNKLILCNDDIFWEFDSSGKVSYVSDNVTQALGYQPKELVGHMPYYFTEDVSSVRAIAIYGQTNEKPGQDYMRKQLILKHKEGNNVYLDTRVMSIIDPETHATSGFVCVTRNVTNSHLHNELSKHNQKFIREQTARLYEQQKEIDEYKQKLESANEEREQARKQSMLDADKQMTTISNICSEITPAIEDIKRYTTIINDKKTDSTTKDTAIQQLQYTADFICTFSKDLIDSSDLSKGITKVSLSIDNIEKTINEICTYHNTRNTYLLKKPIILQREIDLQPDQIIIKTDPLHLRRIINILVGNSYVFTNTGQITVKCSLQSETELLFSVSDTGIGVPEAAYKNMFKEFSEQELPNTFRKSVIRHSGLGLSICKSLVELMGGQIWFSSAIGKGTTISFTIPYIKAGEIASETNAQYNWQGHTALIATKNRFKGIFVSETLAKTNIKYRCIHIDDYNTPQESEYFRKYDVIITDCTDDDTLQSITQKYPSASVVSIYDNTSATAICKEIDKKITKPL